MKILLTSEFYPPKNPGGAGKLCQILAQRLCNLGHLVHVCCIDNENDAVENDGSVLITRIKCPVERWGAEMFEKREEIFLPKILESHTKFRYDIVHDVGGFLYFTIVRQFTIMTQVPLVSHLLILMKPFMEAICFDAGYTTIFHDLQMLQCSCSKKVIVTSKNDLHFFHSFSLPCPIEPSLIYNAVDMPEVQKGLQYTWEKKLPSGPLLFLFAGRINDKNKGVKKAVEFIQYLNNISIESKLIITDPSNATRPEFDSEHVVYFGRLPEPDYYALIASVDITICLSNYEAFGLVAVESGLMNTPVIATATGIHTEILGLRFPGIVVEHSELTPPTERVLQFIIEQKNSSSKTNSAFKTEAKEFNKDYWVDQILSTYSEVLNT